MSKFPKIKGLTWLTEDFPDLVAIDVTLVDKKLHNLGIDNLSETKDVVNIDLSKLVTVSTWYPEGSDDAAENQCSVDLAGIETIVADIRVDDLLAAWIFYKRFHHE